MFAEYKHGPLTMGTGRTPHFELGDLRAVCAGETPRRSEQAEKRQWVLSYWSSEVMDPLGWSKPIDGDEVGSALTSGYKSIMGFPIAARSIINFSHARYTVDLEMHSREVDNEADETELAVERSLT